MKRESNRLIPSGVKCPKKCVYCGEVLSSDNKTKDHVPPRFIFKDIRDSINENRITVPCCYRCNQKYSVVEERLKPLFEQIYKKEVNPKLIGTFNQTGDFSLLMTKIALGYRHHETSKVSTVLSRPIISYFFSNDVDAYVIESFKRIRHDDCIEDISSNKKYPGLIITLDDAVIATAPTDIFSEFWHEYNVSEDYVRMSFYDTLFVQVQF